MIKISTFLPLLGFACFAAGGLDPYLPYSYFPAMGHTSDSTKSVASQQRFELHASVTDTDTWQREEDKAFVTLPNPNTSVTPTIRSGTLISTNANYDNVSGAHSYTFVIDAIVVPPGGSVTCFDDFQADDTGSVLTDPDVEKNTCTTTVSGTQGSGG